MHVVLHTYAIYAGGVLKRTSGHVLDKTEIEPSCMLVTNCQSERGDYVILSNQKFFNMKSRNDISRCDYCSKVQK